MASSISTKVQHLKPGDMLKRSVGNLPLKHEVVTVKPVRGPPRAEYRLKPYRMYDEQVNDAGESRYALNSTIKYVWAECSLTPSSLFCRVQVVGPDGKTKMLTMEANATVQIAC
jgi:hypothetical protein